MGQLQGQLRGLKTRGIVYTRYVIMLTRVPMFRPIGLASLRSGAHLLQAVERLVTPQEQLISG